MGETVCRPAQGVGEVGQRQVDGLAGAVSTTNTRTRKRTAAYVGVAALPRTQGLVGLCCVRDAFGGEEDALVAETKLLVVVLVAQRVLVGVVGDEEQREGAGVAGDLGDVGEAATVFVELVDEVRPAQRRAVERERWAGRRPAARRERRPQLRPIVSVLGRHESESPSSQQGHGQRRRPPATPPLGSAAHSLALALALALDLDGDLDDDDDDSDDDMERSSPPALTPDVTGSGDSSLLAAEASRSAARRPVALYPNLNPRNRPVNPFSRSAAKRQSVMTLGSIEHLQHYFTKTGLAAAYVPRRPPGR